MAKSRPKRLRPHRELPMTKIIVVLLFIWIPCLLGANPEPRRWDLDIGDVRQLKLNPKSSLRLSQKNVLEIEDQGEGRYQLIALRSGMVYVRELDENGVNLQSWIVDVASRSEAAKTAILRHPRWKPLLCMEAGVHCNAERSTISGRTESLSWLHKARDICEKHPPCRFQVLLSEEAQTFWSRKIASDLGLPKVGLDAEGYIKLESTCQTGDSKREELWRKWVQDRFGTSLQLQCISSRAGQFRLDVIALAHKHSDSELNNPLALGPVQLLPLEPIEIFLKGLSQRSDTRILAKPQLALNLGSTMEVSDGMDIATLAPQRDQTVEIWKAVGFQLQLKLIEQQGEAVKAAISLQLSRPREGQRSLDRSALQTETWLTLDSLQLVGQIQARTEGFEESRIPWLGSIPFIGGLFRWNMESEGESQVYLLLRLQKQGLTVDRQKIEAAAPSGATIFAGGEKLDF